MINIQKYIRPETLEEAYELNQKKQNRIIAGMMWTKMSRKSVHTAIDLTNLGLDKIEEDEEAFYIGAMVTLRELELHSGLADYSKTSVAECVRNIIGVQFRNTATVGGSIWGRFGFSDVLTLFLAMDAYVELYKGGTMPLEEFVSLPYDRDILVRIVIKKKMADFAYQTVRNQHTDFPVLTCAVSRISDEYRAVIGARPKKAVIIRDEKGILNEGISEKSAKAFGKYVAENTLMESNLRGSAAYRTHLATVLTERCLLNLEKDFLGGCQDGN